MPILGPNTKSAGAGRLERTGSLWTAAAVFLFLAILPPGASAGFSRGGPFRDAGYGARAGALGGALVALGGDEGSVYWNPACLADLEEDRVGLSYVNLIEGLDARRSQAAYAGIFRERIDPKSGERLVVHAGGAMFTNTSLDPVGEGGYSESALRLAYSYSPDYFISFGVALDLLLTRSDFDEFDSKGSSLDFGMRVKILPKLLFAFVARNTVSRVTYGDGYGESLQRSYTLALALPDVGNTSFETDLIMAYGGPARTVIGAEHRLFSERLRLRAAVSMLGAGESRTVPHFGLGIAVRRISLDYDAELDTENAFGDIHRFSLGIALD